MENSYSPDYITIAVGLTLIVGVFIMLTKNEHRDRPRPLGTTQNLIISLILMTPAIAGIYFLAGPDQSLYIEFLFFHILVLAPIIHLGVELYTYGGWSNLKKLPESRRKFLKKLRTHLIWVGIAIVVWILVAYFDLMSLLMSPDPPWKKTA